MTEKLRVAVLFGGRSAEHEVSLVSAGSILAALSRDKYHVVPIGIAKTGRWLVGEDAIALLKKGREDEALPVILPPDPTLKKLLPASGPMQIPGALAPLFEQIDVVFPVLHGTFGEDGTIQGLLEIADLPYVGAGVLGSSVGMDKIFQKQIYRQSGLPVVDFLWLRSADWLSQAESSETPILLNQLAGMSQEQMVEVVIEQLGLPVFVKPPNLGSSVGISKAHDAKELKEAIDLALQYDRKAIIEKAVPHAREIEVSVLGNDRPGASIAGEVIPSNEFYDYDAKYVDGKSRLKIPAELPDEIHQAIQITAIKAVLAIEAEGMARVDFLLNSKSMQFYLSEVNTIPGFTSISMYPKLWEASGIAYADLLDALIRLALERHHQRRSLRISYQPKTEWYS